MNVTIVNFYGKGGMLYYAVALANALCRRCDIRLVLPRKEPGFYKGIDQKIMLVEVDVPEDFSRANLLRLPFYAAALPGLIRKILKPQPDIVHFTNENIWLTTLIPFMDCRRLVWTLHDPLPHSGDSLRKKMATNLLARSSSKIFVHYKFNFEMAQTQGYEASKLVVIPHGDYSFYEKYVRRGVIPGRMVLFWGRIRPYKGIETLVDCLKYLPDDVQVVIAGQGAGAYELAAARDGRIRLIDKFLSEEEIAQLCQECSVVATPYTDASQSGIVPVAYAFSRPVVATNVGALPEQVEDGVTGLLVQPGDPKALAEAIDKLLRNPHMAASMGIAGFRKSHSDMSWDSIAQTVCETYDNILEKVSHGR